MKLFIFPHDGTLDGDSSFYPGSLFDQPIPYFDGMTLHELRVAWVATDQYFGEEEGQEVKGGWVLDEVTLQSAREFDSCLPEAGSDSSCYRNNHALKNYMTMKAIKFLGPVPQ